jgi:DNA-directed RNA polymerase specialized sigma24 family protein
MIRPGTTDPVPTDASLLQRYAAGDDGAATLLHRRYADRLRAAVAPRARAAGRFDADDVVQGAFGRFFAAARRGECGVPPGGSLWGLLLVLGLNEARTLAARHRAGKRSVIRTHAAVDHLTAPDPTPHTIALLDLQAALGRLPAGDRAAVELRLAGHPVAAVAAATGRSTRSVERLLNRLRVTLTASESRP